MEGLRGQRKRETAPLCDHQFNRSVSGARKAGRVPDGSTSTPPDDVKRLRAEAVGKGNGGERGGRDSEGTRGGEGEKRREREGREVE